MSEVTPGEVASGSARPSRRGALKVIAAGAGSLAAGGLGGFAGGRAYAASGRRAEVPGFAWTYGSGIEDASLRSADSARMRGDPNVHSTNPADWPTAGLVGTLAIDALQHFAERPQARLGLLYTTPSGVWQDGWGLPQQVFGGLQLHQGEAYVTVALRQGRDPALFTWALSGIPGNGGDRLQLPSVLVGVQAVGDLPAGIPLL